MPNPPETKPDRPLTLLSVVIPARDEEGCIASTIEHLHLELSLRSVPHEIVVVDDGSTDSTWQILQGEAAKISTLRPIQNPGPHGFGRAITKGLDSMAGDAVVIMMADESDDCRDVVRYWHALNEGYDCVFGSRFLKHGGVIDYPPHPLAAFQHHGRTPVEIHPSRLHLHHHSHYLAQPPLGSRQTPNQGNGQLLTCSSAYMLGLRNTSYAGLL
jgi:glycosyltransferase involved in cell wall biosynthesis